MLLAAESFSITTLLIALIGSGGLISAVTVLVRIKPDANNAAVAQAHGAIEMMQDLYENMESERNYWEARWRQCSQECIQLRTELEHLRRYPRPGVDNV